MRPKLLKSFIVVLLFWFVASTLWWSLAKPETNLAALHALKRLLPFVPVVVPAEAGILGAWKVQLAVLAYWSLPILVLTVVSGGIGLAAVWFGAYQKRQERDDREAGHGTYRKVTLTKGELPLPLMLPRDEIELGSNDNEALARMTERELAVLREILGIFSAHPNAYAGEGVTGSLLEHALNLSSKALTHRRHPGLAAIVAAAHELGKIVAYEKQGDGWQLSKPHDREAARVLSTLDSWWALPELDRTAVMLAVCFNSKPRFIPDMNGDPASYKLARDILSAAEGATSEALAEEKQRTLERSESLEKKELPEVIFETFVKALPQLPFQSRGLPKGVQAVAWKVGSRVYMLEIKLRETVLAKMPADVRGALTPNPKDRARVQPFTLELLKALEAKGWLVRKIDATQLEMKEALWNIQAGKLGFKGVIIIDVPEEFIPMLPAGDSMYEVAVTGTLFTPAATQSTAAGTAVSKDDLLGMVLRPAAAPKKESSADSAGV
jgi:hypothetical protein